MASGTSLGSRDNRETDEMLERQGPARRIQRAARACEVRCDASTLGVPCTNCQAFGFDCKIPDAGRKKRLSTSSSVPASSPGASTNSIANPSANATAGRETMMGGSSGDALSRALSMQTSTTSTHISPTDSTCTFNSFHSNYHSTLDATTDYSMSNTNNTTHSNMSNNSSSKFAPNPEKGRLYIDIMDEEIRKGPIADKGRVAFLGESSNLSFMMRRTAADDAERAVFHYPIPVASASRGNGNGNGNNNNNNNNNNNTPDDEEIEILKTRGAFLLPPKDLCDELVATYFEKIAPQIPIVNRTQFMAQYGDAGDPPPLLLLQVIFLAASRVCRSPALLDADTGTTNAASMTFWKRAKALYDADYEQDKVVVVQALLLLGWWWEGPEDVTRNVWYWIGTAIRVAQGIGMHRSLGRTNMGILQKRTWKRIWWTCFAQDRRVAVGLGRPMCIDLADSDTEPLTPEDFIEEDETVVPLSRLRYPPDPVHVQYFLHSVALAEIMGAVLSRGYTAASSRARADLTHSDMALANWLMNLPIEMRYVPSLATATVTGNAHGFNFWAAFLHMTYYTTLCLLHRPHVRLDTDPPLEAEAVTVAVTNTVTGSSTATHSHSRNIAFAAANMTTRILQDVVRHNSLDLLPSFSVYAIFSAMIFHSFETRSANAQVAESARMKLQFCQSSLKELSRIWLVATPIVRLFEAIAESKQLQDRLQKTAMTLQSAQSTELSPTTRMTPLTQKTRPKQLTQKIGEQGSRKRRVSDQQDDPARIRVLLPVTRHSRTQSQSQSPMNMEHDAMLGGVITASRPPSPFRPAVHTGTATPPDFYFVTGQQPMPQTFWENYQPNFLFPQDALQGQEVISGSLAYPAYPCTDGVSDGEPATGGNAPESLNVADWYQYFGL